MQDRRRAPKGTPQEEMEAAKRELEVVRSFTRHAVTFSSFVTHSLIAFIPFSPHYRELY